MYLAVATVIFYWSRQMRYNEKQNQVNYLDDGFRALTVREHVELWYDKAGWRSQCTLQSGLIGEEARGRCIVRGDRGRQFQSGQFGDIARKPLGEFSTEKTSMSNETT